jgi:membrane-associated two-gene conflict system component 1 (EACC1)
VRAELRVLGDDAATVSAAMRSLEAWLAGRDELRGRVRPVAAAPRAGEMGSVGDVLAVALGQGGAATAVATATASVLISWIRHQRAKVSVTAKRSDGTEITVSADHVSGVGAEQLSPLVAQVADALNGTGDGVGGGEDGAGELDRHDAG